MLVAATMGATAFQKGLGGMHALAHPIGALFDTHHGLTNAVLLTTVALADVDVNFRTVVALGGVPLLQDGRAPIFFRIYLSDAEQEFGTFRIGVDVGAANGTLPPDLQVFGSTGTTAVVPEPSTLALGGIGLVGLALGYARRRKRAMA